MTRMNSNMGGNEVNDASARVGSDMAGAKMTNANVEDTGEAVRQLNSFLRGEISAAETYRMAIDKAGDSANNAANIGLLREILCD